MVFPGQAGQVRSEHVGGQGAGLLIEGVDLLGDDEVLVGDGAVGDLGLAQRHVQRLVSEHRGDGLDGHAPVDGLRGQGVPQDVGVDVRQPRPRRRRCSGSGMPWQQGCPILGPRPRE